MSQLRNLFVASALALAASAACATTVAMARPAASGAQARYATRDQLRDCLDRQAQLMSRLQAIEAGNAARAQAVGSLDAEGEKLRETKALVDRDNPAAVLAFKQMLADYNAHVVALDKESADANAATEAYNADGEAVNQECTALTYRTQDMDAVLKARRKPAPASAAAH